MNKSQSISYRKIIPYTIFTIVAFLMLLPQIIHGAYLAGTDSAFHMNRFYEAAMQIKTGHFSYYQSLFGLWHSGRIVNAFYGPIFAYLNGGLLLLSRNWLHFQLINSCLVLTLGGASMYLLCIKNHVTKTLSILITCCYETSYPISLWVTNQEFTGWGSVWLPLIILCGTEIVKNHQINSVKLAILIAILVQIHLISSIIGCLALIPFILYGFSQSNHHQYLINLLKTFILTIILTANIWGNILDIFLTNHIIPIFPLKNVITNACNIQNFSLIPLGTVTTVTTIILLIAIIAAIIIIINGSNLDQIISWTGLSFLWFSSQFFPWEWVQHHFPTVTNIIQFPKRLSVIAIILLLLSLGKLLSQVSFHSINLYIISIMTIITICSGVQLFGHISQETANYESGRVNQPTGVVHINNHIPNQMKNDYHSHNLFLSLKDLIKETPDYLPSNHKINSQNYYQIQPYKSDYHQFDISDNHFHHSIIGKNTIKLVWDYKTSSLIRVPLAVYHQSQIDLNGHSLNHRRITRVGALIIRNRKGHNHIIMRFIPDLRMKIANLSTILGWLWLLILAFIKKANRGHDLD